jgi:hypothetical protein
MRIPSLRNLAAALNAVDPFRVASWLADKIRRHLRHIEAGLRRRRARRALLLVRVDMAEWRATTSIPAEERDRLARCYRRTLYPLYYVYVVMNKRLEAANLRLSLICSIAYFALLPHYALPAGSELDYLGAIFIAALGGALLYGLVNALVNLAAKFFETTDAEPLKRLQVRGWAVLGLVAGVLLWVQLSNNSTATGLAGQIVFLVSAGVFGGAVIIFMTSVLYGAVLMAIRAWSQHHHPDAFIVRRLFDALRKLEAAGSQWMDLEFRTEIAAEIGGAGVLVRQSLFQNFRGRDAATVQWRSRQAIRISAAFAEKQQWLMTPKADTREVLLTWLARSVVALLSGAWDDLELLIQDQPAGEAESGAWGGRWTAALLTRLRTLAVGVLPVLLFVVARRFDLVHEMAPDLLGYAELALLAWGVLILMFMLDPEGMKEKISTMREAVSVLRPDRKKD